MFWQDRGVTSSQVPTQPQRTHDTRTIRMQPVAAALEPAWPTTEPLTATNLPPVAAVTTKFEPVAAPPPPQPGITPAPPSAITPEVAPAPPSASPATAPVQQVSTAPPTTAEAPAPSATAVRPATPPAKPRSRLRRIARRIVGPNLLTKKG